MSSKVLDLKLTYRCNNDCKYCCQDRKLRRVESELSLNRVKSILDTERDIDKVVLTGGEATLSKNIFDIINLIKSMGISNVQLQSNAKKLKSKDYLSELIEAGITSFGISLHGCSKEMHEAFTGTEGSFDEVICALNNLKDYIVPITLNCVLTKYNVNYLKEIVEFVQKNEYATALQFAFIHITGKAESGMSDYVKISEAAAKVKEVLLHSRPERLKIFTEAIPFCLMQGFEKNVSELYSDYSTVTYDYRERRDFSKSVRDTFKSKGTNCVKCLFYYMCDGPWIEYPREYGYDEFIPVTNFRSEY